MASRTLQVVITGDARGAQGAFRDAEGSADSFGTKMGALGDKLMGFGSKMTLGVSLPLGFLGIQAFNAASDLNESLSKVGVVFDDSAGQIKQWSLTAAESMGISRREALEAAGTFGNLFTALGIGKQPAADMSQSLVQLAVDLGSLNNEDPALIFDALRAGLVGEAEPLRRFGVDINAAALEAKALALGIWDGVGALDGGQKAQAAYAIIMEKTTTAQGDFARTADGAAGKQKTLNAKFDDAKAKLGNALIPIFQQFADILSKVADWFSKLDPKWQKLITYAGLLLIAVGPLATVLGGLLTVIAAISLPVLAVVAAIGILIAAGVLLYTKWDEIWNFIKDHPAIAIIIGSVLAPLILIVGGVVIAIKLVKEHWDVIWPAVQSVAETVWGVLKGVFETADTVIRWVADAAQWVWDRWQEAWPTIQSILETAWGVMQGVFDTIVSVINTVKDTIGWLQDRWGEAWPIIQSAIDIAWKAIQPWLDAMKGAIDAVIGAVGWIKDNAGTAWDAFKSAVETMWSVVQTPLNLLKDVLGAIVDAAGKVKNAIEKIPSPGDIPGVGLIGKGLGALGLASGGPVNAGQMYLVGEQGPELFVSNTSGRIVPNHQLGVAGDGSSLDGAAAALVQAAHALIRAAAASSGQMPRSELQRIARAS